MHLTAELIPTEWHRLNIRLVDDSELIAQRAVEKATQAATQKAKEGRFKDRTGDLRQDISPTIEGWNGKWFWGLVTSPNKYAKFVEYPTVEHDIHPKAAYNAPAASLMPGQKRRASGKGPHEQIVGRGYALRWKDGNGEHFARMVHHPGTEGKKYMYAASIAAMTVLRTEIRNGFVGLTSLH